MEELRIFRNTSVPWRPSAVVALATSSDGRQVAAAREDCSVEIWLVSPGSVGWHCQMRIHGESSMRVTCLVWLHPGPKGGPGRLISSGIDGSISEWDLFSLKQKVIVDSIGVSIWQMAVAPFTELDGIKRCLDHSGNGYAKDYSLSDAESCQSDDDDDDKDEHYSSNSKDCQRVAIACDDGCVRLYSSSISSEFSYKRSFPRVSGRILSVAWSVDGKLLFTGTSDGMIRCWDTTSVRESYRITVGTVGLGIGSDLCVWSLLFLRCGTLVSADSNGNVQFWDSQYGALLQMHSYHKGDATALAVSPGHNRVFSAGSDGQVILYKKNTIVSDVHGSECAEVWAYVDYKRVHSHDIRALTVAMPISSEDSVPVEKIKRTRGQEKKHITFSYDKWAHLGVPMLLSAGDDSKIFAYSAREFNKFSPHDICPAPQNLPVHMALDACTGTSTSKSPLLLVQSPCCLDILSVHLETNASSHICTGRNATTQLLAQIKSKRSRKIICSAISGSGTLIGYSDHFKPNLIELRREKHLKGRFTVTKKGLPREIPFSHCMIFGADSSIMMLAGHDRKIYIVDVNKSELLHTFVPARKEVSKTSPPNEPPITKMFASNDGQWLAAINCFGDIYIFDLQTYRQHWFISRMDDASVTAGGFPPRNSNILVITTSSNQVYIFDVEARELGPWSRHHSSMLPRRFQEFPGDVIGLTFPPSSTSVIVYSARAMCMIDFGMPIEQDDTYFSNIPTLALEKLLAAGNAIIKRKREDTGQESMPRMKNFDFCSFNDLTLHLSHLSEKSLFVLQKPWSEIVRTFDAPVHRHIYGT